MSSESNPIVELEETAATEVAILTATSESETEPTPVTCSVKEEKATTSSLRHYGDDMSRRVQKRFGKILALTKIAHEQT